MKTAKWLVFEPSILWCVGVIEHNIKQTPQACHMKNPEQMHT